MKLYAGIDLHSNNNSLAIIDELASLQIPAQIAEVSNAGQRTYSQQSICKMVLNVLAWPVF